MSRIDVVPAEKGTFKVLVNFIQRGVPYHSPRLANQEAKKVLSTMRGTDVNYAEE